MTNAHVVDGAQRVRVTLSLAGKFQRLDAKVIGVERLADLALLKIDAHICRRCRFNSESAATRRDRRGDRQPEGSAELGDDGRDQFGVAAAGSGQSDGVLCRPTRRSIAATAEARWWTSPARSSA